MILLDTDVLIIDLRYTRDARFVTNRQFLDHSQARQIPLGITCQTLLEVVGKFSFNVATSDISQLVTQIPRRYATAVLPDPAQVTEYAGCTIVEVLKAIETKMALGDAVNAVQIARYAASASCLLSWNARHYLGKLVIPVLTPQEWLQRNQLIP